MFFFSPPVINEKLSKNPALVKFGPSDQESGTENQRQKLQKSSFGKVFQVFLSPFPRSAELCLHFVVEEEDKTTRSTTFHLWRRLTKQKAKKFLQFWTKKITFSRLESSANKIQWTPLNMAASGQAKMAIITGWLYYPGFLFSKKSKFLYKSGHIYRLYILSVDILRGVYCNWANYRGFRKYSRLRLIEPPEDWPYLALISGVSYYPAGLFSKNSKFITKGGSNKRCELLIGELLTEVYCTRFLGITVVSGFNELVRTWPNIR